MTDFERYSVAGSLLLCRDCGNDGARFIVKDFKPHEVSLLDVQTEAGIHESERHEPTFDSPAAPNVDVAVMAALELGRCVAHVQEGLDHSDFYRCYPKETAYRDGMANGMGGAAGELAGLLGPDAVRPLARALRAVATMGRDYPELVQDHDRRSCDDFTCEVFGHLVDVAKAVTGQLPN